MILTLLAKLFIAVILLFVVYEVIVITVQVIAAPFYVIYRFVKWIRKRKTSNIN